MVCKTDAKSQSQGTRSNKEKRGCGSNRGCNSGTGQHSQEIQCQSFAFTGNDREGTDTPHSERGLDIGGIIEQLIRKSLSQAQQHEKTAEMLYQQAQQHEKTAETLHQQIIELKVLLTDINNENNE